MIKQISNLFEDEGYSHAIILPCERMGKLIEYIQNSSSIETVLVTREEEGVGISAGLFLSGKKPFMLIQSSGLGNSINAICSLLLAYQIPLLFVCSYRGYYKEKMEAQLELGIRLPRILDGMGVEYKIVDEFDADELTLFIRHNNSIRILLLSPRLFE